jgi:hypothetical protein
MSPLGDESLRSHPRMDWYGGGNNLHSFPRRLSRFRGHPVVAHLMHRFVTTSISHCCDLETASTSALRLPGSPSLGPRARTVVSDVSSPLFRSTSVQLPARRSPTGALRLQLPARRAPLLCHQSVARPMIHIRVTNSRLPVCWTTPRLLHRPIESHDGTRLATHLHSVARAPARHSRTAASSPCSSRLLRSGEIVAHPPSRFPASPTRSLLRALPASARLDTFRCRGALAHTHTAVACGMRPSPLTHRPVSRPASAVPRCSTQSLLHIEAALHALHSEVTNGVDPSFDIPPDSCPPGSRLRQHQQRLPVHLCPPRGGPPSRFPKTMTPPSAPSDQVTPV